MDGLLPVENNVSEGGFEAGNKAIAEISGEAVRKLISRSHSIFALRAVFNSRSLSNGHWAASYKLKAFLNSLGVIP